MSTDVFRPQYRELTDQEKQDIARIKVTAQATYDAIETAQSAGADPRACSLAKTNLEQSVMWAVKGITG